MNEWYGQGRLARVIWQEKKMGRLEGSCTRDRRHGGIGLATAKQLVREGAYVFMPAVASRS